MKYMRNKIRLALSTYASRVNDEETGHTLFLTQMLLFLMQDCLKGSHPAAHPSQEKGLAKGGRATISKHQTRVGT